MGRHVALLLVVNVLLLLFQLDGLPGRELAALDAVGDAVLLVLLAGVDFIHPRVAGIDDSRAGALRVGVLGEARDGKHAA